MIEKTMTERKSSNSFARLTNLLDRESFPFVFRLKSAFSRYYSSVLDSSTFQRQTNVLLRRLYFCTNVRNDKNRFLFAFFVLSHRGSCVNANSKREGGRNKYFNCLIKISRLPINRRSNNFFLVSRDSFFCCFFFFLIPTTIKACSKFIDLSLVPVNISC